MPLFSVVVPTFNRKHLLRRTLESVMRQSCQDFEVIVVDDGSTDGTDAMVADFSRVLYLRQHNKGPGAARNLGWDHARGEYLAFLDSDDLYFPWTLGTYKRCIEDLERPSLVSGEPYLFYDEQTLDSIRDTELVMRSFRDYFSSAAHAIWMGAGTMLVRRSCRARFPDEMRNGEDLHLCLQLGEEPGFAKIDAPPVIGYRYHGENAGTQLDDTFAALSRLVRAEAAGDFPGGPARASERRMLISRFVRRPASMAVKMERWTAARRLYTETFAWQVQYGRWKFLLGLPILALSAYLRSLVHLLQANRDDRQLRPETFGALKVSAIEAKRHAEKAGGMAGSDSSGKIFPE